MDDQRVDEHDDNNDGNDEITFRVETEFDADPATVWRALTEPESMAQWLGRSVELALEPGAEGTLGTGGDHGDDGDDEEGEEGEEGDDSPTVLVVEEVDDERRLVFRWASATQAPTLVELDLAPVGRRTRLTIVERPLQPRRVAGATARACALALAA